MALNVGDTVAGRYLLVERLGAGGMGVVFRAQDTTLGRDVALKVLLPHVSGNAELIERFRREARVLAKLRNPGIIVVHDLVTVDGDGTALILEYVGGGSLDDRISQGPLPWPAIAGIGVAAAEALAEAHDAGIVHRDIKPSNILLEPDGGVRVADFGIAQVAGETGMTMQGEAIGTPAYMSPEQAQGTEVGPASDIYSLGAVLFAAATGRTPFVTQEGGFAAALAHITQPVPDPRAVDSSVPDAAAAIIMRAMQKAPEDRFASARELAASLRASANLMSGDIPIARPAATPSEGPPPTLDPAPVPDDATRLGTTPPPPPPPPPLAPAVPVAAEPLPPVAVPVAAGSEPAPSTSMNKTVLIGAGAVIALVVVGVIVTLIMTSGSGGDEVAASSTPATGAPTAPPSTEAPPSTSPPSTPPPEEPSQAAFAADFSNGDEGFVLFDNDLGGVIHESGRLILTVRQSQLIADTLSPAPPAADVEISAVGGYGEFADPREGELGIMCRYENFENHYAMGIRSDGSGFIRKRINDVVTELASTSLAFRTFDSGYRISASCIGTELALKVDGRSVLNAQDADLALGRTGLFAGTTAVDTSTQAVFISFEQTTFGGTGGSSGGAGVTGATSTEGLSWEIFGCTSYGSTSKISIRWSNELGRDAQVTVRALSLQADGRPYTWADSIPPGQSVETYAIGGATSGPLPAELDCRALDEVEIALG